MKHCKSIALMLSLVSIWSCGSQTEENILHDESITALIEKMSLEEKVSMVHGEEGADPEGIPYVGYLPGIERLAIPPISMQNGPSGAGATFSSLRHKKPATAFPVPIAQASTWNRDLLRRFGRALGSETKAQGRDIMLAPMINIIRIPEGGRNFELFSEDPYLSSRCAVEVIKGIQEMGTMANAKVLTANNQETWRHSIDEIISERALREIYLPSMEASVKEAKVASIMTAYNKINGVYCSENPLLLREIVKEEWGFQGFIMTDWGTWHKTVTAANAGLDLEMSGWGKFGEPQFKLHLLDAVKNGAVSESTLDEMVYRILREMKRFGHMGEEKNFPEGRINSREHQELALQMALEGAVLLKNEKDALPLDPASVKKLAVFGDAERTWASGGGSSNVVPFYSVTPLEGLRNRLNDAGVIYYKNYLDGQAADAAIVFLSDTSTEDADRSSISLEHVSAMIENISGKYDKTIVMLRTPGAYTLPWIEKADAIFQMWFPGQEEGNAEAALIFGDVCPSGKLPLTFGLEREDYPATKKEEFPGVDERVEYTEGIFVGYRYFEHFGTDILFPFGHGLSYTEFSYSNLKLSRELMTGRDSLTVSYVIKNEGTREGAEVSQLYIADLQAGVERPPKELKGFNKVFLIPGESREVSHTILTRDLSFWDEGADRWRAEDGEFMIQVGASSADIRLSSSFTFKNE